MEMLATPGVLVGLLIGVPAGMAIQHARHVVRAYQSARTNLPTQKEAASSAATRGAVWIVTLSAIVLLVILVVVRSQ